MHEHEVEAINEIVKQGGTDIMSLSGQPCLTPLHAPLYNLKQGLMRQQCSLGNSQPHTWVAPQEAVGHPNLLHNCATTDASSSALSHMPFQYQEAS